MNIHELRGRPLNLSKVWLSCGRQWKVFHIWDLKSGRQLKKKQQPLYKLWSWLLNFTVAEPMTVELLQCDSTSIVSLGRERSHTTSHSTNDAPVRIQKRVQSETKVDHDCEDKTSSCINDFRSEIWLLLHQTRLDRVLSVITHGICYLSIPNQYN